jgi:GGDEF domain-containing protein
VIVGLAGHEGDLLLPDLFSYLESSLRVEDAIFHMTRERAVLFLADVGLARAREVMERSITDFRGEFPHANGPEIALGYFEVQPGTVPVLVKDVLPSVFPAGPDEPSN